MKQVLFVCTGNICRSPTAEGLFRQLLRTEGLEERIGCDSAATHDYHIGKPPDSRTQKAARARGLDLSGLRARQVTRQDFHDFDLILAMGRDHYTHLRRMAPADRADKVRLFLDYSPTHNGEDVPDPYYGGSEGFERVLDIVASALPGLLQALR
jgi:protein-tyrosine phosphatase